MALKQRRDRVTTTNSSKKEKTTHAFILLQQQQRTKELVTINKTQMNERAEDAF